MKPALINLELLRVAHRLPLVILIPQVHVFLFLIGYFVFEFTEKINMSHSIKTCSMKQLLNAAGLCTWAV